MIGECIHKYPLIEIAVFTLEMKLLKCLKLIYF